MLAEMTQNRPRKNGLSLNLKKKKTETMIFGTSIRVKKAALFNIQIKGTSINQTSSYK